MTIAIFSSLMVLALGVLTSISLLSLSHILIALPCLLFLNKENLKALPKSAWALLGLSLAVLISVLVTQDIADKGYTPIGKIKYFIIGVLSIAPFTFFFHQQFEFKKVKILLNTFVWTSAFVAAHGILHVVLQFHFLRWRFNDMTRSAGVMDNIMSYAHAVAFMVVILVGLNLYKRELQGYLSQRLLEWALLLNAISLYMTYTRGVLLAIAVAIPFYFFKKNKKIFVSVVTAVIVVGVTTFLVTGDLMRPKSDEIRLGCWQGAIAGFKERPIFGLGFLNYSPLSTQIKYKYNLLRPDFAGHAHSNYLEILATTGIFGSVFFLCWLGLWLAEMYKRNDLVARIAFPFIIVFIVGGVTQSTVIDGLNMFFIMAAYSLSQVRPPSKNSQ